MDLRETEEGKYKTYFPKATTPAAIRKEVELAAAEFEELVKSGKHYDGENIKFADLKGRPIYPDSVGHKFHEIIQAYNEEHHGNIPDINFHGTRHTSATLLISEGLDVVEVSHRLGHSKTSTTEDIYAHQLEKVDEHAAAVLDSILNKSR